MVRVRAEEARKVAEDLKARLEPCCERIEIAGSLRRQLPDVGDIEFLIVPKREGTVDLLDRALTRLIFDGVLDFRRNKRGSRVYGRQNKLLFHVPSGIGVDVFSTDEKRWAIALVVRTGSEGTNKQIAMAALKRGWRFRAYGDGYDTPQGHITCRSEREVFEVVGMPYLEPWER